MPDKDCPPSSPADASPLAAGSAGTHRPNLIQRGVTVLEHVAEAGGASARDIAEATGIPLPTVYRIAQELVQVGYLIHLREEKRFALGYKLHTLGARLHEDLGVPREIKQEIARLHADTRMAAYLAIHRGADFGVIFVADSPCLSAARADGVRLPRDAARHRLRQAGSERLHR